MPRIARAPERVAASFRDPSGYVFQRQDRLFRAIDETCYETLRALEAAGLWSGLMDKGWLVRSEFVEDAALLAELRAAHEPYRHFLKHERIAPLSFPYEWSFSMLADAGLLTLDLQRELVEGGFSLKDATAYNVQFVEGRPVFIDLPSIERPKRQDIWAALGQFGRMFTFPLMLTRYRGWDLRSYFLANIGGLTVEQVARAVGRPARWRPRWLLDVTLPNWLGRRRVGAQADTNEILERKGPTSPKPQLVNLRRLRSKIAALRRGYKPAGHWASYTSTFTYDDEADRFKQEAVRSFLEAQRPPTVLDLGCNTGTYSRIAAECGARVIAVDSDHDAVEVMHRELCERPTSITPMVADLASPSPALGFRNREREPWLERARADAVLALALVHHLMVSANLSPAAVGDLLADLAGGLAVVEFVPTDDVMFQELLKQRVGPFEQVTLEDFIRTLRARFEVLDRKPIPNSGRTLLFLGVRR